MKELVSIVVPVFNSEEYIEESIESCLNQTYSKIEVIAINDGSTDNSLEILNGYADRIRIISQKNKGIAGAINTGIKSMKSNWYKLMNADDILYPECVEILVSELEKINNKKIIPYGQYDVIDSTGKKIREIVEKNRNNLSSFEQGVELLDYQYINCITTIFHKDTFEKYGFYDESMEFSEDYELLLRLCLEYGFRFHIIDKKLAKYRYHEKQDTIRKYETKPNYGETIRQIVLNRLNLVERKKYEIHLNELRKKNKKPISIGPKRRIKNLITRMSQLTQKR